MRHTPPTTASQCRSLAKVLQSFGFTYRKERNPEAAAYCDEKAKEYTLLAEQLEQSTETPLQSILAFATFAFVLLELYLGWSITP